MAVLINAAIIKEMPETNGASQTRVLLPLGDVPFGRYHQGKGFSITEHPQGPAGRPSDITCLEIRDGSDELIALRETVYGDSLFSLVIGEDNLKSVARFIVGFGLQRGDGKGNLYDTVRKTEKEETDHAFLALRTLFTGETPNLEDALRYTETLITYRDLSVRAEILGQLDELLVQTRRSGRPQAL